MTALCRLGVEEILVMDGTADARECVLRDSLCPGLRVRYNDRQNPRRPVSQDFLLAFDRWIEASRREGRRIAIRCRHGWHRTGRLAAYYRMRFQGSSPQQASQEMAEEGRMMWRFPGLGPQVEALAEWIHTGDCRSRPELCPLEMPEPADSIMRGVEGPEFAADICGLTSK